MTNTPETPNYKPGDVVNGHRLVAHEDGRLEWLPLPAPVPAPMPAQLTESGTTAKNSRRGLWITLGAIGGVLLLIIIIGSINRPRGGGAPPAAATTSASEKAEPAAEEEPIQAAVPDVAGQSAILARAALEAAGFSVAPVADEGPTVLFTTPLAGTMYDEGAVVTLTIEEKPKLTVGQENALGSAQSYLAFQGFSRSGLIGQLEYEGYSTEDATFAADNAGADWNAEAAESATSYMKYQSFSREGLYDQLIYEGFSDAEANAGLAAVGY